MKTLKSTWILLLLAVSASFVLTSCLGDDDDDNNTANGTLTPQEKILQAQTVEGFYTGKFYFDNDTTNAVDSVDVSWTITAVDSTLVIPDFPIEVLANCVYDTTVKTILKAASPRPLTGTVHFYYNENKDKGYYTFMMVPNTNLQFAVELNGNTHNCCLNFTTSTIEYNAYGQQVVFYPSGAYYNKKLSVYMLIESITINSMQYPCDHVYMLSGQKS